MVAESLFKDRYSHRFATILNHDFPRKTPHCRHSGIMGARPCYRRAHFHDERQRRRDVRPRIGLYFSGKDLARNTGQALFGHPADVSPVGHFSEYFVFGASLLNALRWHLPAKNALFAAPLIRKPLRSHRRNSSDLRPHALLRPGRLGGRHRCGDRRCDTCLRRD